MRKTEDYRLHAQECRQLATRSRTDEEREMLEKMAETWESLAKAREEQIARAERLKRLDELSASEKPQDKP